MINLLYFIKIYFLGGNLVRILFLLIIIFFCVNPISAAQYQNVINSSVSGTFHLNHTVERVSFFKTIVETSLIKQSGQTRLGRFFIKNNTRDGFKLTISSDKNGVLAPTGTSASMLDGEVAIPYDLTIIQQGEVGEGIDVDYEHESNDLTADFVSVLTRAGTVVSSLTDAEFSLYVSVIDDSNIMEMAGTYTDTLTLTYEDL